jgi:hypothetical protein
MDGRFWFLYDNTYFFFYELPPVVGSYVTTTWIIGTGFCVTIPMFSLELVYFFADFVSRVDM